jgi:hypothetical protein
MDPSPILEDISISDVTDERTSILNETNGNQDSISNGIRDVEELSPVIYDVSVEKLQHLSIEPELQQVLQQDQTDTSHNDQEEQYSFVKNHVNIFLHLTVSFAGITACWKNETTVKKRFWNLEVIS